MKRILFITVLALVFYSSAIGQIITFTDPIFKAKLLSATTSNYIAGNAAGSSIKIDTNNDGQIQVSEALSVVYLNIPNSNLTSLNGIENFTNIKYLYCHLNSLTSLPIENLTQLRLLRCSQNQLTSLSSIQNLTQLVEVDFSDNQITSVSLQNLSNLNFVIADNNLLNEIDICGTNVYRLYCGDNPNLTSINLKNNVVTDVPFTFEAGPFPSPPFHTLQLHNLPSLSYICHDNGEYNAITSVINSYSTSTTNYNQITFSTGCVTCTEQSVVNLKLNIQGYYDAQTHAMKPAMYNQGKSSNPTDVDEITVELRTNTGALAATTTAILKTNGNAFCAFPTAPVGSYYLVIKNRNMIKSSSSSMVSIGRVPLTYNFANLVSNAFSNNMVQLESGIYGFYSGDSNQDNLVDGSDYSEWEMDANNFAVGDYKTDFNGDGFVDGSDYSIWEENANNFINSITPSP